MRASVHSLYGFLLLDPVGGSSPLLAGKSTSVVVGNVRYTVTEREGEFRG